MNKHSGNDPYKTRESLIERIQNDNTTASSWEDFSDAYRRFIYIALRNNGLNHHDCEEVVQRVMIKVWEKIARFKYNPGRGKFRYWLYRVSRNEMIDFVRAQQAYEKRNAALLELSPEIEESELRKAVDGEWRNYIANMALERIKGEFKTHTIESFLMHSKGVAPDEIAKKLGMTVNSVYLSKRRILDRLKEEVRRLEHELG